MLILFCNAHLPVITFFFLYSCQFADSVRQGENGKHRQETPQRNHFLASLRDWLPNLGFSYQERSKSKDQQPPQQKHLNETSREEFQKRRRRVNYVCAHSQVIGNVKNFMTDKQAGVFYCIVPKAGCTFWKRIFTALNLKVCRNILNLSTTLQSHIFLPFLLICTIFEFLIIDFHIGVY